MRYGPDHPNWPCPVCGGVDVAVVSPTIAAEHERHGDPHSGTITTYDYAPFNNAEGVAVEASCRCGGWKQRLVAADVDAADAAIETAHDEHVRETEGGNPLSFVGAPPHIAVVHRSGNDAVADCGCRSTLTVTGDAATLRAAHAEHVRRATTGVLAEASGEGATEAERAALAALGLQLDSENLYSAAALLRVYRHGFEDGFASVASDHDTVITDYGTAAPGDEERAIGYTQSRGEAEADLVTGDRLLVWTTRESSWRVAPIQD